MLVFKPPRFIEYGGTFAAPPKRRHELGRAGRVQKIDRFGAVLLELKTKGTTFVLGYGLMLGKKQRVLPLFFGIMLPLRCL